MLLSAEPNTPSHGIAERVLDTLNSAILCLDGEGRIVLRFAGPITERVLNSTIRPAIEAAR